MNAIRWHVMACAIGVAAGCSSAPVHYYTLAATPSAAASASQGPLPVEVRVVHLPSALNHSSLMVRSGRTELILLENERWASPVKDEIAEALRLELQRRLAAAKKFNHTNVKLMVQLDVRQFDAELANRAWLDASYSATLLGVHAPAETRTVECGFRSDQNIQSGYAQVVAGYQRDIAALADAIVATVTTLASGADAECGQSSPPGG